jgi:hypothetical protein
MAVDRICRLSNRSETMLPAVARRKGGLQRARSGRVQI